MQYYEFGSNNSVDGVKPEGNDVEENSVDFHLAHGDHNLFDDEPNLDIGSWATDWG